MGFEGTAEKEDWIQGFYEGILGRLRAEEIIAVSKAELHTRIQDAGMEAKALVQNRMDSFGNELDDEELEVAREVWVACTESDTLDTVWELLCMAYALPATVSHVVLKQNAPTSNTVN